MRDDTTSVLEPILGDGRPLLLPVAASLVFSGGFALFLAATGELPSLYTWLTIFPLEQGQPWAWWVWLVSSAVGLASFLTYLGYGYLDSWHGVGTLLLLPVLVVGMVRARRLLTGTLGFRYGVRTTFMQWSRLFLNVS